VPNVGHAATHLMEYLQHQSINRLCAFIFYENLQNAQVTTDMQHAACATRFLAPRQTVVIAKKLIVASELYDLLCSRGSRGAFAWADGFQSAAVT
jgi:hypothetical protein